MNQRSVKSDFIRYLRSSGQSLETIKPSAGVDSMLGFYANQSTEHYLSNGGDMLLYQWGTYDWGDGKSFEFDITRQSIFGDHEDEDIIQLSLTFEFLPTDELTQLASGNRWCRSRAEVKDLENFIRLSAPFLAVNKQLASSAQLEYCIAG
jgi:hypothetical protein